MKSLCKVETQAFEGLAAGRYDITGFAKAGIDGNFQIGSTNGIMQVENTNSLRDRHSLPLLSAFLTMSPGGTNWESGTSFEANEFAEAIAFVKALASHRDFQWYADSHQAMESVSSGPSIPAIPPRVLIIAGSDSGGGAGIQADMKACTNLRVFSSTAITAVTAQNTLGVHDIFDIPVAVVCDQIGCVMSDIGADVIKVICWTTQLPWNLDWCRLTCCSATCRRECSQTKKSSRRWRSQSKRGISLSLWTQLWWLQAATACSRMMLYVSSLRHFFLLRQL